MEDANRPFVWYWCNALGNINVPGAKPGCWGTEDDMPPQVQYLYRKYWTMSDDAEVYVVCMNGEYGVMVEWFFSCIVADTYHITKPEMAEKLKTVIGEELEKGYRIHLVQEEDNGDIAVGIFYSMDELRQRDITDMNKEITGHRMFERLHEACIGDTEPQDKIMQETNEEKLLNLESVLQEILDNAPEEGESSPEMDEVYADVANLVFSIRQNIRKG